VVHRILKEAIKGKLKEREIQRLGDTLPEIAAHSSRRERVAMDAEREIVELKKMQFMQDKVGEEFDGFITGIMPHGFFVELTDLFVEGLVHVSMLPRDFYQYIEKQHALFGENSRRFFRIGDKVRVRLVNVSLEKKQMDFTLAQTEESKTISLESEEHAEYTGIVSKGKRPEKGSISTGRRKSKRGS